jgi:hypothetical protein
VSGYARSITLWFAVRLSSRGRTGPTEDPGRGTDRRSQRRAPPTAHDVRGCRSRLRGIDFLLRTQRRMGLGRRVGRPIEIADVPGRTMRSGSARRAVVPPSGPGNRVPREAVRRGLEFLLEHCRVRRPNGMKSQRVVVRVLL